MIAPIVKHQWFSGSPLPLNEWFGRNHWYQWFFNGFWSINHWPRWFFSLATIGLDGFAMVFGLATIGLNGFSMVANHWSNDGMVTIHRYRLCLMHAWRCLVVSLGVNVYWLVWPELIDVYGQISLPVHVTYAAKMLMLPMHCCCVDAADALLLLMR